MAKRTTKKATGVSLVRVKLVKSTIGFDKKQAAVAQGLGLKFLNDTVAYYQTASYLFTHHLHREIEGK